MKKRKLHSLLAVIAATMLFVTSLLQSTSIAYASVSNPIEKVENEEQTDQGENKTADAKEEQTMEELKDQKELPLEIEHEPPSQVGYNQDQYIQATVPNATTVQLVYQATKYAQPIRVDMKRSKNDTFTETIPGSVLWSDSVDYWIEAKNNQEEKTSTVYSLPIKKQADDVSLSTSSLLITEVNLREQPFIELYNNTNQQLKLNDYTLSLGDKKLDIPESTVASGKTIVLWLSEANKNRNDFNQLYETNLTDDQLIMLEYKDLPTQDIKLQLVHNQKKEDLSTVSYSDSDTAASQLYYYHEGEMKSGGLTKQAAPINLLPGQVPENVIEIKEPTSPENQTEDTSKNKQEKAEQQQALYDNADKGKNESTQPIQHEPITSATDTNDLTITATAPNTNQLTLHYRTGEGMTVQELAFTKATDSNVYTVTIPKEQLWSPTFSYRIVAEAEDGTTISYPETNDIQVTIEQTNKADPQTIPPLLITEITPDTANINGADAYEFIEVYNNSNQPIQMSDYQIIYRYPTETADQHWDITNDQLIEPQDSFIIWIKNDGNQKQTVADFNTHYGLTMPESHVAKLDSAGMANGSERTLIVADKYENEIIAASYNQVTDDTNADQGIVYTYPAENDRMVKAGIGEGMTPLTIIDGQAPEEPVVINDTSTPVIESPTFTVTKEQIIFNVTVTSEQEIIGTNLAILQSEDTQYQTWSLQASEDDSQTYTVTIPREEIWRETIQFYVEASNQSGDTKTDIEDYTFSQQPIDYQEVPPLLITEITPDTTNLNGADGYEFIEVYNNSTESINFKDYSIRYRYPNTSASNDLVWGPEEGKDIMIPSGESIVFWVINHGNTDKQAADFNAHFQTNLVDGDNLFKIYNNGMANGSERTLLIATKTGEELSYASYNDLVDSDDTVANKGIFYRYPIDGSLQSTKISAGEWDATPGETLAAQVPTKRINLPADREEPIIKNTTTKKKITSEEPVTLSAAITDNIGIKSAAVYYRTDEKKDFRKVNLEKQADNHYQHIVYEPELIGKQTLEYYFVASDGRNQLTAPANYIEIENPFSQEGLRLNLEDNQLLSGEKVIKATADTYNNETQLFIDDRQITDTFEAMETEAYFAFDVKETNIYFKNGVTMGDEILEVFDDTYTDFTTLTVPVSAERLQQGENTISIRAGNKVSPFDETSEENRDDFMIKNIRLVLTDGTTIYDPAYSDPSKAYSIGDSPRKDAIYDFNFNLEEEQFTSTAYVFDTTSVEDGKHEVKTSYQDKTITTAIITDNTSPTLIPSINEGKTYKGEFTIDAEAKDATSEVTSITATLDGEYISLPYETSSALLKPGSHELVYQATDKANNVAKKKVSFSVTEEHPLMPDWLSDNAHTTSANLSVTVKDPTNDIMDVNFHEAFQYTAEDENITISQNAVSTEPPIGYLPDGEDRLTKEQRNQLQALDGNELSTESKQKFPYHRFDVRVDKQVDKNDEIEIVWNGSSLEGRKVTMYAWNYETSKWAPLVSTIAGKEAFQLIGSVKGLDYVQDQKVSVIVQDQIANPGEDFSFVWMADTQYYSESYPYIYDKQVDWIANNQDTLNIEYVFHSGDLVNVYDDFEQWDVADRSMRVLDDAGIPYGVVAGNHDVYNKSRNYENYYQFFGADRFDNNDYYGGSFQNNRGHYDLISANGMDFIMVHLGWGIEEEGIEWLNEVLQAHPNRKAILNVHEYLLATGSRSPTGDELFEKVVVPNENVFAVLCGHYHNAQTLIDEIDDNRDGISDRTVYQMLADYQGGPEGGQGYLRILNFNMENNQIDVQTYSPHLDDYNYYNPEEYPGKDTFSLDYDMAAQTKKVATDYLEVNVYTDTLIDRVENVPSGEKASVAWQNLDPNHEYFWYVEATDKYGGTTRSDIWSFLTEDGEIVNPGDNDDNKEEDGNESENKDGDGDGNPSVEKPKAGSEQDKTDKNQDDSSPLIENTSNNPGNGSSLPDTATSIYNYLLIGALFLLAGLSIWLIYYYRRRHILT
ncbi:lamin tail domain-containing protein [Virgibacillus salexigens]|uniref:lamin tail domain-containing protein n=1 Tax=Virgibacillus salexigens TaxID=61016 RepID=UPI001909EF40|nr:lamin tail domain-containing protein [Virgibacillus salexigens]